MALSFHLTSSESNSASIFQYVYAVVNSAPLTIIQMDPFYSKV